METPPLSPGSLRAATDTQCVVAALLGSLHAFDELVRRYRPALTASVAALTGCGALAEDVVQDAFVLAFRHLSDLDAPESFGAWLRTIARHRARRRAQSDGRATPVTEDGIERLIRMRIGDAASPEQALERRAAWERLLRAVDDLPDDLREPLLLQAVDGWSVGRVAGFLDVPEATVRGRLYRARTALRRATAPDPDLEDSHG